MKKFFRLFSAATLLLAGISLTACDDDDIPPPYNGPVLVRSVEVSPATLTLEIGEKQTLTAKVLPESAENKTVAWSSSSDTIATVNTSTGEVTGVDAGTATITVTTADGGKTATCTVMVMPEADPDDILTMIPDPLFRAYCEERMVTPGEGYWEDNMTVEWWLLNDKWLEEPAWDTDGNGKLSPEEAAAVGYINVSRDRDYKGDDRIVSMKGIEYFTGLINLQCACNRLASLDVSNNTALKFLDCDHNLLTYTDVSNNTALEFLDCGYNQLTSLDVSKNIELTYLDYSETSISKLDVSMLAKLEHLDCYGNHLTSLDVSKNTALTELDCSDNRLTVLDVSNNTALTWLQCSDNRLTVLDVSNNTALTWLQCSNNRLTALDVSNNTALTTLWCFDSTELLLGGEDTNQIKELDLSNNPALTWLICYGNLLTSLDVSKNIALNRLNCDYNDLISLDVSENTALTYLNCRYNQLTSMDISRNTALTEFWCDFNPGNGRTFPVAAWFDNASYPHGFLKGTLPNAAWYPGGPNSGITVDYRKVN
jgi:Leucine-rich repeat (LRR) protein